MHSAFAKGQVAIEQVLCRAASGPSHLWMADVGSARDEFGGKTAAPGLTVSILTEPPATGQTRPVRGPVPGI